MAADDGSDEDEYLEHWVPFQILRVSDFEDIYDICWSPDDQFILVGLTDNTFHIWDVSSNRPLKIVKDHSHFVQGVAWDPLNEFLATQSSDRYAKIIVII
jgi:chromatin assembly factor 1 subunit B